MITTPTLPATIPGLLRRGSPVIVTAGDLIDHRGLFVGVRPDGSVDVALDHYRGPEVKGGADDSMALDLTDPTGRAHAAWWLAGEPGASWALDCDGHRRWTLSGGETPRGGLSRSFEGIGADVRHMRQRSEPPEWGYDATDVPALDHLDPDDDTRLPDGSRWVDAEALRLVCLHVAGVSHG